MDRTVTTVDIDAKRHNIPIVCALSKSAYIFNINMVYLMIFYTKYYIIIHSHFIAFIIHHPYIFLRICACINKNVCFLA